MCDDDSMVRCGANGGATVAIGLACLGKIHVPLSWSGWHMNISTLLRADTIRAPSQLQHYFVYHESQSM
jgi:hypothetical protein